MKKIRILIAIIVLVLCALGVLRVRAVRACHARGLAVNSRIKSIETAADSKLHVGSSKDDVVNFFRAIDFPVVLIKGQAYGSVKALSCSPFGCGTDEIMIRVQVDLDSK